MGLGRQTGSGGKYWKERREGKLHLRCKINKSISFK